MLMHRNVVLASIVALSLPFIANGNEDCLNATFFDVTPSPLYPYEACYPYSPYVVTAAECMYYSQRLALSRFYDAFPLDVFYPVAPKLENLDLVDDSDTYITTDREEMENGTKAIEMFIQCGLPFSILGGGYSNAGASVMMGHRLLALRFMGFVDAKYNYDVLYGNSSEWDGMKDIGTVTVGAGGTAGLIAYFVNNNLTIAALPVGQHSSIGIGGLTLGGGIGPLTRFGGLLCDRIESLTAIVPTISEGKAVTVTKYNEYSDLFWASCGGGGGNFAIVTEFVFKPLQVCQPDEGNCSVQKLYLELEATTEAVMYYQEWSVKISTRITPNLIVKDNSTVVVEGIFLGDYAMWEMAVDISGATNYTAISSTSLLESVTEMSYSEAINSLTEWNGYRKTSDPATLLQPLQGEERTYFKYKSFFLFDPLPAEAIQILIDEAMYFEGNYKSKKNKVVFQFQALGGDLGKSTEGYANWSPQNMFAAISPKDTAFPHRGALHCLTLKSDVFMLVSGGLATRILSQLEAVYDKIAPFVKGSASYYNYIDPNLPIESYFQNGVQLNPGITNADQTYWIDRLREVKNKYNPNDMLGNPLGFDVGALKGEATTGYSAESSKGNDNLANSNETTTVEASTAKALIDKVSTDEKEKAALGNAAAIPSHLASVLVLLLFNTVHMSLHILDMV